MTEIPNLNRRTYVGGLAAAAAIAAGAPTAISGAGDDGEEDGDSDQPTVSDEIPAARPFIGDLTGEDLVWEGDMKFDVQHRYDGDPAVEYGEAEADDREWVIHKTTEDEETGDYQKTQDYPAAMINLRERLDRDVSLGGLRGEDGSLTFDYFVGKMHDQYIPGQVFLVVQDPEQKKEDKAWGLYKNARRGGPHKEWATFDVVEEMRGAGATESGPWRAVEITIDPDGFRGDFDTFSDAIFEQAMQMTEYGKTFDDVFDMFGHDAKVLGIGLGCGSAQVKGSRDIYYDNYQVTTEDVDETFEIPAALRMVGDFDSRGQITATLEFETDQEEVDLDDLDEDTVRIYPFSQIMPPLSNGAEPSRVIVDDEEIEARFPPGQVRGLDGVGTGSQRVVVAGQFDYDHVVWFYAIGEVDVPGN